DVNDNAPEFSQLAYPVNVSERTPGGQGILQVTATDADSDENAKIQYSIVSGDEGKFVVQEAFVAVHVHVTDANDQPPVFTSLVYEANVTENERVGTMVTKVEAKDPDVMINSKMTYSLHGDMGYFAIDGISGEIKTAEKLDREVEEIYRFYVNATDDGDARLSSQAEVRLDDANDFPPSFSRQTYYAHVTEGTPVGTLVINLNASDPDTVRESSHLVYRIIHEKSSLESYRFVMDPESGDITTQSEIDRERIASYNV
ncbi:predicted protein, partial [Nematostella vectensis]